MLGGMQHTLCLDLGYLQRIEFCPVRGGKFHVSWWKGGFAAVLVEFQLILQRAVARVGLFHTGRGEEGSNGFRFTHVKWSVGVMGDGAIEVICGFT